MTLVEIKSLLESRVSPRQSPPCPKLIYDIDYYEEKLLVGGSIFKSDHHSKGYLVGGEFTKDVDVCVVGHRNAWYILSKEDEDKVISNKVYEIDLLPCSSIKFENLMLEESKRVRALKCCKSNPIVKKVNGFVYVLHRQPLFRSEGVSANPTFERINLESDGEEWEWEALDDPPPFLTNSRLFDTIECVWDDSEAKNEFSNAKTTFTMAGLYPPNGGLYVFRVLDRYHGKVAALMSGTTLDLELEGVLCILKFALHVKPEVTAKARDIERLMLVSFKPKERAFVDIVDVPNYICQMNSKDPFQYLHGTFFA
ncbi:hypothetical protein Ancab_011815 [Ancistrocladus abbreviatus]